MKKIVVSQSVKSFAKEIVSIEEGKCFSYKAQIFINTPLSERERKFCSCNFNAPHRGTCGRSKVSVPRLREYAAQDMKQSRKKVLKHLIRHIDTHTPSFLYNIAIAMLEKV